MPDTHIPTNFAIPESSGRELHTIIEIRLHRLYIPEKDDAPEPGVMIAITMKKSPRLRSG